MRLSYISNATRNPILYFRMILDIIAFVYKLAAFKRFWKNGDEFVNVLNHIQRDKSIPSVKSLIQNPAFIKLWLSLIVCMAVADLVVGSYIIESIWQWSPQWWFRKLVALARYVFIVGNEPQLNQAPELDSITHTDIGLAVVTAIAMFQRFVVNTFKMLIKWGL